MVLYCGTGSGNTPSPGDPSNPSQLVATPVFEGIRISWDFPAVNPETVAHFIVYRSTTNIYDDADTFKITSSDSITDFLDVSLPTTYFYWVAVRAVNGYIGEIQGPAWATAQPKKVSILDALSADINASKLALDLQESIGKIDILEDTILLNETNRDTDVTTLTNLIAQVNEDTEYSASIWQEEITTRATDYNALSQSIVTQQTTLGDNTASIEILSEVADGISGEYYVKIDNNGAMTGFGLSSEAVYDVNGNVTGAVSQFIVDANRFVIRDSDTYNSATNPNSVNPFIVDSGITYINEAVIKSIQSVDYNNDPGSQFTGWKIDRSGSIEAAAITIYASDGTTILQAGDPSDAIANSAQAWSDIGGTGKPANDATRNFFRGLYLTTADYVVGDMVTYESEVYICILNHVAEAAANTTPSGDGTANTYWDIFSKKGDPGISISSTVSVDGVTTVTFSDGSTIVINDGTDGAVSNARSVSLSAPTQAIAYDSEGNTPSPSANFVVTATSVNTEGTAKYTFKVNGIEAQAKSTSATYTYTPPTTYAALPDVITVELTEDSDTEILDTDTYTIFGVKPGVTGETGDNPFTKTDLTAQYKPFTAGSGAIDFWNTSENTNDGADVREIDIDAFGGKSVIWKAINGHTHGDTAPLDLTDNDADGGFNSARFAIDHTKLYRYSIFIKQDTDLDGGKYWGTHGYSSSASDCIIEIAPNTATDGTTNPYFWTGETLPTNDEWYLIVGYVFPSDTVGTPHLTTEMYHVASGQKVAGVTGFKTFKWLDTALESNCRAYQYYNARDVADEVWFWQPRVDAMVDDTPSIQDILRKGFKGEVGNSGLNGASVNIIFQRAATAPSTPETSSSIPTDWADSPSNSAGFLWASKGTTAVDSNDYVWETPYQVDGSVFAEITIFKKAVTANTPTTGSYNFTNSTLTAPSGWSTSIPAISANNEIIYASVGLFSGASTDSAVTTTWSSPVIYAQRTDGTDGAPGDDGNPGDNALTIVLSNEVHTVPANAAGSVDSSDYLGSGTIIRVYDGAEQLDYDAVGTTTGHYTIVAAATGITINAISQTGPRAARVADFSAMTADVATVEYTITGKNLSGVAFETTKTQTITKSKAGVQGNPGSSVSIANTSTSNGVTTITFNDSNGSIDISDGSDGSSAQIAIAYASSENGANASFTAADNLKFVKYHEYTGTAPSLDDDDVFSSGFVRYIGEDGSTPTNSGVQTFFAENANGFNKSITFLAGLEYVNLYEWTETRIANNDDIPDGLTYVKFSGTDGTTPQLGVDYFNAVDPSIFTWRGNNTWPTNTDYAGGDKYTFTSTESGKCLIKVLAFDAESGAIVGLNGTQLGTMLGPNNATQMYSFTATNLIAGSNEISIWSSNGDGGAIKEIHVFHIAADGINGTSIKLEYSLNGSNNWHDEFAVGDLYVRSGTKAGNASVYTYGAATKFVPEKGVEYDDGDDGTNAYLHLAYGTSATGTNFSQDPAGATYIGSYTDTVITDSANPSNYTWAKIRGEDGTDGTGVKVVYASYSSGTDKSFTQGTRQFVKYHEYTGSVPLIGEIPASGFVRFIGEDGSTPTNSGVKPVYSIDGTSSTENSNLSFIPFEHQYVTFYEWTGSAPISINDLNLAGAVFVKFEGTNGEDGEDGVDGLRGGGLDLNFINAEMDATGAVNKISTSTSWNSSVHSTNSYEGGCYLTFKTLTTDVAYMVALNETSDVTNSGYATLDFAWNIRSQGNLSAYESGVWQSLVPAIPYYSVNDVFSITYDNDKVRYLHNGVVMRTVEVGPGKKFHFDSSIGYKNTTQLSAANIKVFTDVHFAPQGNVGVDGTSALIPNLLPARLTDAIADDNFNNYEILFGILPTDNIDTWDVTLVDGGYGYDSNGNPINYWVPPWTSESAVTNGVDAPSTDLNISPTDFQGGSGAVTEFIVNYNNAPATGTWKALSGANRGSASSEGGYPQGGSDQGFEVSMTFVPGVKSRLVFEKLLDNSVVPPTPSEAWLIGKRSTGQSQAYFGEVDQLDILFDSKKEYLISFDIWESNGGSSATEVYGNKFDTRGSKLRLFLEAGLDRTVDTASYASGADTWESTSASNSSGVWNRVTLGPYSWSADYPRSTRGRIRVIVPNPTVESYQVVDGYWVQRMAIKNLSLTELNINASYDAAGNLYPVEYRPPLALKLTAANKQTYISNLSVDTLQIANQAVVVPTLVTMPQVTLTRGALTTPNSIDYLFNGGGWLMDFILPVTGAPISFFLSRTLTEGVSQNFTDIKGTQASGGLNLGMSVSYEHPVAPTINNYLGQMQGYVNLHDYSPYRISREHFGESTKLFNFTPDLNQWKSLENGHLYADEIRIKVGLFGTSRRVNAGFEFNITLNALCLETKK